MNSLIPAFNQIRLAGQFVTISGLRVQVANDNTLMVRDSGNFANQQQLTGLSGFLQSQIGSSSAGVSMVNGASGSLNIVGTGTVSVTTVGQTIYVSGNNADAINLSGYILNVSGGLEARIRASGQAEVALNLLTSGELSNRLVQTGANLLTTIASTGQQAWLAAQNNALNLSGNNYISYINATGFVTGVVTGSDYQYVWFPRAFSRIPAVQLTMDNLDTGNIYYFCGTSKRSTTGFFVNFSDTVLETGIFLSVWASI